VEWLNTIRYETVCTASSWNFVIEISKLITTLFSPVFVSAKILRKIACFHTQSISACSRLGHISDFRLDFNSQTFVFGVPAHVHKLIIETNMIEVKRKRKVWICRRDMEKGRSHLKPFCDLSFFLLVCEILPLRLLDRFNSLGYLLDFASHQCFPLRRIWVLLEPHVSSAQSKSTLA